MPPKPVFKTAAPFTETQWPDIPAPTQEVILDLVCNLLEPLGEHRHAHIQPSKGKKRKRPNHKDGDVEAEAPPPVPELSKHVLVGLNSVTRHLSALAAQTAPPSAPAADAEMRDAPATSDTENEANLRPLSLVIVPHPQPASSLAHAHLPTLIYLSSTKSDSPTRLVTLPTAAESRLASTLHIPRVGALGIMCGAPGADSLVKYVLEHVGEVEAKWIVEGLDGKWKGVKIVGK